MRRLSGEVARERFPIPPTVVGGFLASFDKKKMAQRHSNRKVETPRYKSIEIFRDQILGRGGFGQVCKAKCDDLPCAAKMLYLDLCRPHLIGIIEQEYEFLSSLSHPNIVQYLPIGMYHDPSTGQLGVLMELMDENLTQYLKRSSQPVPYHLQVNISHDVALALSFLHANNIVHRNITGNNILLTANAQVIKVCDFVSSAIIDTFKANDDDLITFSSTPVYMSPEAVTGYPKYYTEKIDCFSFGVVVIQILTREYPKPADGDGLSNIDDHRVIHAIAPEIERRQNHISKIDPSHPLLSIALDCLKDRDVVRPSAHQLCERIQELKETRTFVLEKDIEDLQEQLVTERQQHIFEQVYDQKEIHRLREEIKQKVILIADVFENAKHQQRLAVERELQNERRQISQLEQQLMQSQEETRRVERELTQQLRYKQFHSSQREQELTQARQHISVLRQQIRAVQQRASHSHTELTQTRQEMVNLQQLVRAEQQRASQSQSELTQARQQMSNLQQLVHAEQQRASQSQIELTQAQKEISREREQVHEKDERIRELEHRLEIETLGSQLQLLSRGNSWNVPRREIQITKQIGYGAAGLVSKGRYQGQEVAVKQIHREILREKHIMDEFKREVGIMATIQHPNLVRFIAAVFDERVEQRRETPLLVLELLHTNLRDAYQDYNLSPNKSAAIFRDVAYGLHYLHEHSEPIIHRDVSAPNILLESLPGDMWRAKLSDFGSANFLKHAKTLGVGAIVYTAPEMFPREGPSAPMPRPTAKCDVFSYGIVLVEVITKTMPTTENRHQLFGEVKRKWRLMYDLISQCTEVSPHARPTMAEVLNSLNRIPTARPR